MNFITLIDEKSSINNIEFQRQTDDISIEKLVSIRFTYYLSITIKRNSFDNNKFYFKTRMGPFYIRLTIC
jgi:hypothetical protein